VTLFGIKDFSDIIKNLEMRLSLGLSKQIPNPMTVFLKETHGRETDGEAM
jgi:hypothetical protein